MLGLVDCPNCGETGAPVYDGCQDVCSVCASDRIVENPHATDWTEDQLPEVCDA
jgi:hypothetical protein